MDGLRPYWTRVSAIYPPITFSRPITGSPTPFPLPDFLLGNIKLKKFMTSREEQLAILRHQQKQAYTDSLSQEPPMTSARLDAIDPGTGLDIVALPDGGSATAQRIFKCGHPKGTFVRATEAPGGTTAIDWLNAPDRPENVEDEQGGRTRKPAKELDSGSMAILYISDDNKEEPVECRCTTYKKVTVRGQTGFQAVCDGSGEKEPGNLLGEAVELRWTPLYDILDGRKDIADVVVCVVRVSEFGDPFVPFLQAGDKVHPISFINSTIIELLRAGVSVIFRMDGYPATFWSDPGVHSFLDTQYAQAVALNNEVAITGATAIKHPTLGMSLAYGITFWRGDIFATAAADLLAGADASMILPHLSGSYICPFSETRKGIVQRVCQDIILPTTGVSLQVEWVPWVYGDSANKTFTVSKLNAPNPVSPSVSMYAHGLSSAIEHPDGKIRMPLPNLLPTLGSWSVMDGVTRFSHEPGSNASGPGYTYQGEGDRLMQLGFIAPPSDAVGVKDEAHGYLLHWEGSKLNPEFKGNVVIDLLPNSTFREDGFIYRSGTASLARVAEFLSPEDDNIVDKAAFRAAYVPWTHPNRDSGNDQGREAYTTLGQNLPFWLSPRNKSTKKPGKAIIVFWLGGISETPIKITELNKDDPYEAYLSSTPEKIFVTVKASKEYGYKALELKNRPWCTITTWELDRETMTLSEPEKFTNPEEVTSNQDDWQKIWAHDYNPIDPAQAKPAKFDIPTTRFGVSTTNHTFNLSPFIQGSDPALIPKLTNITFASVTAGGSGSVLSWDTDALTFVYKGDSTNLYTIVFNYTIDDGASTASNTITLNASMITPNLLYEFRGNMVQQINLPPQTLNIGAGDAWGNIPQVMEGRTRTLVNVEFESVGVEDGVILVPGGALLPTPARLGSAWGFNPLGSFTGFDAAAFTAVWADNYVRTGRPHGAYTAKLRYTISDGTDQRTGVVYIHNAIAQPSFR